jgi:ELWxxDGT repeat protein
MQVIPSRATYVRTDVAAHNLGQPRRDVRLMKFRRHPGLSVGALPAARLIAAAPAQAGADETQGMTAGMATKTILFEATDSDDAQGLWVTDGTGDGTYELVQGNVDDGGLSPDYLVGYKTEILFGGQNASGVSGLYVSNGTAAGTSALAVTGASTAFGLEPTQLTVFNGSVYFAGFDASNTIGLWVTNGTAAGTSELAVSGAGSFGLNPTDLTVVNTAAGARLAFGGADADGNSGLWVSDGTAAGTTEIYVGPADTGGVGPSSITALNPTTFLFEGLDDNGDQELYVSDGTTAGTSELTNITGAPTADEGDFVYAGDNMAVLNGHALFAAYDETNETVDLWTTDGTAAGTSELMVANANALFGLSPTDLTTLGNKVLFDGVDADGESGLWVSDGTAAGTRELTGIADASTNFQPSALTVIGNEIYFNAIDAEGNDGLWVTDGTVGGTTELTPISDANEGFYPSNFTQLVSCYATGTRIRTLRGDVAVEDLAVGEMVVTHDGDTAPIIWIGRREVACETHPAPASVRPVRVLAGAFGLGLPTRDLVLSPDHAVFADGVLIPIRYLINGRTVVQEPATRITYWHVELPRHAVLLAEGLAAESYLETGQRDAFANGGAAVRLHPDFAARVREAQACAPIMVTGPVVAALRARLSEGRPEAPPLDSAGDKSPDPIRLNGNYIKLWPAQAYVVLAS